MKSTLPFEERRPVPWDGFDVFLMFFLWYILIGIGVGLMLYTFTETSDSAKAVTTEHPLSQLLEQGKESPIILFVAFFSGVISAPLTEEFLFRLLLQGWLKKKSSNLSRYFRQKFPALRFLFMPGVFSILTVSIIFAAAHGGSRSEQSIDIQFYTLLGIGIVNILVFSFGMLYLLIVRRAALEELGCKANRIVDDLLTAVGTFFLSAPFILYLHWLLRNNFPDSVTDPIPLFFFSIILGVLYHRTSRLQPGLILHALLNGFSFAVLVFSQ
jgi:membrane protease YdiL (CAAX protease family)